MIGRPSARLLRFAWASVAVGLQFSCTEPAAQREAPLALVVDSAGIEIVTSNGQRWSDGDAWQLSREPIVRIGGTADRHAALYGVSDVAALTDGTLMDGTLVVAVAMGRELRFFNAEGEPIEVIDRNGSGPGEFRHVQEVVPYVGNTFAAHDPRLHRVVVFDSGGIHVRDVAIEELAGDYDLVGGLGNGSFLFVHHGLAASGERGVVSYVLHDADGGRGRVVETGRGMHWFNSASTSGFNMPSPVPFAGRPVAFASDTIMYVGHGDEYEIRIYNAGGDLFRVLRNPMAGVPLTAEVVSEHRRALLGNARDEAARRQLEKMWNDAPIPEMLPAFTSMMADVAGNLWVCEPRSEGAESCWVVYDRNLHLLGRVAVPQEVHIYEIGLDFMIGLRFVEFGVPEVVVFGLDRSANR